ncbi:MULTISPECIES: hypothetical protein [Methylosinus]|uniref:Uncharacterized protein n=1 Tax=Methylosinus trichosporium (strain ATCC 35070 / NCIMB 11131 / UNIQEM 75 / OB3b) TaxID=595536 RepID=A0A2D2D361_METT3|nr:MULTISPECIES: hypothetical protein [Methylosinus]ATQ69395.1 hypothetical protein CQW49_17020 [Methylosinus trichosporium OB3b]OBS52907.1 hypothetical protein A8B73_08430 [Methylosinus sp. 3S-1]
MLSFDYENGVIKVAIDAAGIEKLLTILRACEERRGHVHLCTAANGGRELDEQTPWGKPAIGEVIIDSFVT